ncbi:hypothetical protein F4776DRAFT_625372 [Hypoxylon sp. NC0597]|nr:hypothetical protein F4776DRAFT_625372 [Hypoxylon sp. NC0597]
MMLSAQFVVAVLALSSGFTPVSAMYGSPQSKRELPPETSGLEWQFKTSNSSKLNGTQLAVRKIPGSPDRLLAVSDETSPVAFTNFHDGELHLGSGHQNPHDTGPTAYMNLIASGSDSMERYEIGFANVTNSFNATTANGTVDKGWVLSELDPAFPARKKLTHNFKADKMGFSLCYGGPLGRLGSWYNIYFLAGSKEQTWDNNGCENDVTIFTLGP